MQQKELLDAYTFEQQLHTKHGLVAYDVQNTLDVIHVEF